MDRLREKAIAVVLTAITLILLNESVSRAQQEPETFAEQPGQDIQSIALKQRGVTAKPKRSFVTDGARADVIIVKFLEGTHVRLQSGQLIADPTDRSLSESKLLERAQIGQNKVLQEINIVSDLLQSNSSLYIERLFATPEQILDKQKQEGESKSGRELADLNLYYNLLIENANPQQTERLIDQLNALEVVEIAYPQPISEPAQADISPTTPNLVGNQGYLNAAPNGIDANHAQFHAGGRGDGIRVIDVEGGWNLNHEDLGATFFQSGVFSNDPAWREHGTAVLGEIAGAENGYGVTGIAPHAEIGVSSVFRCFIFCWSEVASAINVAATQARAGDILLIEQHAPGPQSGETCVENCDQFEFVAMENWQAEFDAISNATARGVIVVEAAGNGSMNLDHSRYGGRFDRNVRDSGAILVGAGTANGRTPHIWSNAGSRVDVQGWGNSVTTSGFGDAFNPGDERQFYTNSFSGTSSASPIVVGAAASVQGIRRARGLPLFDSFQMRTLLRITGTPQSLNARQIGPLPNLRAAIASTPAASPMGVLDGVAANGSVWGWTLDPDVSSQSIDVHFYVDGPYGTGTWAGAVTASAARPDVNQATGYAGDHGFNFTIPAQFINGQPHTLYAYGIDATGNNNVLLWGSGTGFTISANRTLAINVVSQGGTLTTETITVYATDAITGVMVNGTVTVNGGTARQTGQQFTYTHTYRDCDYARRPPCRWVREPVDFAVTAPGYNTATFTR